MGYFRFLLAALVAVQHYPGNNLPMDLGSSAVVAFYFLSGYLMSMSFGRFRELSLTPIRAFYVDRLIRLYPSFAFALAVAAVWAWFVDWPWIRSPTEWFGQLLVIPMSYLDFAMATRPFAIAPTWSLGVEAHFYFLVPAILGLGPRRRIALLTASIVGQIAAMHLGGSIMDVWPGCIEVSPRFCEQPLSQSFAYQWPPGAAVPFLLGTIAFEGQRDRTMATAFKATVGVYGAVLILQFAGRGPTNKADLEILFAIAILVPLGLFTVQHRNRDRLDDFMGRLAYPVFLFHITRIGMTLGLPDEYRFACAAAITLALSAVAASFQSLIDARRYRLRNFGRVTDTPVSASLTR